METKERLKTEIRGFDDLIEKDIPAGSSVVVKGGPGSGKTIFCLQTCINFALQGKKCLYLSFEEPEEKLREHMKSLGWEDESNKDILLKRMDVTDVGLSLKYSVGKRKGVEIVSQSGVMLKGLEFIPKDFKPDLIVIDSLTAISSFFSDNMSEYRVYIEELFRTLEKTKAMSLLIVEKDPFIHTPSTFEEFMADGVIVLYNIRKGDIRESAVEVLKLRGTKHQKKIAAMQITDEGIVVYPEQQVFGLSGTNP
ncbi:MAG: AAA family ATPase [Candidatus Diapherotrites archaeon]|nr:AAA family ATPase [Candidatus Diapherotrites archaeon]